MAQIIVNFELAVINVEAARAHRLASQLEDLVLFDEFTNGTTTVGDENEGDDKSDEMEIENERGHASPAKSGSVLDSDNYRTLASGWQ